MSRGCRPFPGLPRIISSSALRPLKSYTILPRWDAAAGASTSHEARAASERIWSVLQCEALRNRLDELRGDGGFGRGFAVRQLARQFGDTHDSLQCLYLGNDALLHEDMKETLAQHQGDPALWIGVWHHLSSGFIRHRDSRLSNSP